MAISYKVIERGQPGVAGGGTKKFYVSTNARSTVSLTKLAKSISRMSSLSRPDILAVLEALTVIIPEHLLDGDIVELGNLGRIGISVRSGPSDTAAEVSGANVLNIKPQFRASREFRNVLNNANFEKIG